jgi:hypothetical protein
MIATLQPVFHIAYNLAKLALQPLLHVQIVQSYLYKLLKNQGTISENLFPFPKLLGLVTLYSGTSEL